MKKVIFFTLISAFAFLLFLSSCNQNTPLNANILTVTTSGHTFTANGNSIKVFKVGTTLTIYAASTYKQTLTLCIPNFNGELAQYQIDTATGYQSYYTSGSVIVGNADTVVTKNYWLSNPLNTIISNSLDSFTQISYGYINITGVDPYYTGTFSLTAMDSTKIANGSFSIAK